MPYFLVENFRSGLDVRKSILTAPAGTLTRLVNAAITPGGEIRKRKAFIKVADLTGTFGLASIGTELVAFTKGVDKTAPTLTDVRTGATLSDVTFKYHKVPNTSPTSVMVDFDIFDGKIYLVMSDPTPSAPADSDRGAALPAPVAENETWLQTSDNTIYEWRGTSWEQWEAKKRVGLLPARGYKDTTFLNTTDNKLYAVNFSNEWDLFKAKEKGTALPGTGGYYAGDTFENTATGKYYIFKSGNWTELVPDSTGAAFPSPQFEGYTVYQYNEQKTYVTKNRAWEIFTPTHTVATLPKGYKNGEAFFNTTDNKWYMWETSKWLEWKVTNKAKNPHYYFDDREKVNDRLTQNLDLSWEWTTKDNPNKDTYQPTEGAGMGYFVRAYKSKMYCVGDKYLRFSAVNNGFLWEASANTNDNSRDGAGNINISIQEGGSSTLNGVEIYYDKLALFSELSTQMWTVVSDPKQNALGQVLRQTGTKAPWSVQQYGSGDILFLASSGIRSMKARDISNSAAVSDIGSPIDDLIHGIPEADRVYCRSVLEPIFGRVWFAFRRNVFVLSFFPGPNITAWSNYTVDFDIEYILVCGDRLFVRSGNDLYLYGGASGEEHDTSPVEVRLPFLDGSKPGHMKMFQAIDATVTGTWDIKIAYDFDNPDAEEDVATVTAPTWNKGRYELTGFASHMSLRFYNNTAEDAVVSNAAIHYNMAQDSD
jgi:hypothetical protein